MDTISVKSFHEVQLKMSTLSTEDVDWRWLSKLEARSVNVWRDGQTKNGDLAIGVQSLDTLKEHAVQWATVRDCSGLFGGATKNCERCIWGDEVGDDLSVRKPSQVSERRVLNAMNFNRQQ